MGLWSSFFRFCKHCRRSGRGGDKNYRTGKSSPRSCLLDMTGKTYPWNFKICPSKQDLNNDNSSWHGNIDGGNLTQTQPQMKSYRHIMTAKRGTTSLPQGWSPNLVDNSKMTTSKAYTYIKHESWYKIKAWGVRKRYHFILRRLQLTQ